MALQPPVLVPAAPTPRARRSRVTLVVAVLVCVAVPVLIAAAGAVALWWTDRVDTVGAVDFDRPLRIPALAGSTVEDDGTRVFDLTMQTGTTDLTGDGPTGTWGVDGAHLAPTLRAERGETVRVDVRNDLPETSSLHWHGMHVPAAADGGPHQLLRPGSTWSPTWTVDQPAATTWYHPHAHGTTAEHVRRGVYGMFLVDDPDAAPAGLPGTYGVDDVPVMLQDAGFTPDGQLRAGRWGPSPLGATGDTLLVNGTVGPYLDVTTETVRLRLLNASGARVYDLALADGRGMDLVGTDGGLLPAPVRTGSVLLSPGERAEVVVRVEPGERVVLRSLPPDMGVAGAMVRMSGAGDRFDVLELRAADTLTPAPDVPGVLAPAPALSAADATVEREFELSGVDVDGRTVDMARVDDVVTTGTTEEWVVTNPDGQPHSFHVHGTAFVVASVDGAEPAPHLRGWKDTVLLPPGSEVRLAVRFDGPGDPTTPYMVHCHVLLHHDQGMMSQLLVVDPGQEPALDHDASHEAGAGASTGRPGADADVAALFPGAVHDH